MSHININNVIPFMIIDIIFNNSSISFLLNIICFKTTDAVVIRITKKNSNTKFIRSNYQNRINKNENKQK